MIEIKEVCKQDYKKAQKFAIQGMHLDWYDVGVKSPAIVP